jgi:hypothetical protein
MSKEVRHKKEVKKPKKAHNTKHMDKKEDIALIKARVKKDCLK